MLLNLHPYQAPTVFISSDAIITQSRNMSNHALLAQLLKGERENICFKSFSECEIKQNLTWRESFAIHFALQSFAPKISNKSVCWETDNYTGSLTVASESNNTVSPVLLGTQSH